MEVSRFGVPLLMVNGNFRNLNSLTVEELESFIPFMTAYSMVRGGGPLVDGVPEWWGTDIRYEFPLRKPDEMSDVDYRKNLLSMVCKCYCYHNAHFLLSFSSKFYQYPHSIFLRSNGNDTTSIFSIEGVAEMFTFDNENKYYDDKVLGKLYWNNLMPTQQANENPRVVGDIFLCENCDIEFYSEDEMKNHEKRCCGSTSKASSNDVELITHYKLVPAIPNDQNSFLSYFGLHSKSLLQQNIRLAQNLSQGRPKREIMARKEKCSEPSCSSSHGSGRNNKKLKPKKPKSKAGCKKGKKKNRARAQKVTPKAEAPESDLSPRSQMLLKQCKKLKIAVQRLALPEEADYFVISILQKLIIPYRVKKIFLQETMLDEFSD